MWKQICKRIIRQQREEAQSPDDKRKSSLSEDFFEQLVEFLKVQGDANSKARSSAEGEVEDGTPLAENASFFLPEDSDTPTKLEDQTKLLSDAVGTNIEILYGEILHMMLHTVGCNANEVNDEDSVFRYLQAAFKFNDEKNNELLEQAKTKEAPEILLHVEVMEAKDLTPMDANGLSDSFCTLYLTSAEKQQHNTSIKLATLCPEWRESFCLPIKNPSNDSLCVEVWDFDPAETIHDKVMKVNNVKGMKGWGKFVKEFGSTGKDNNEFIGKTLVSLDSICTSGEIRWCDLEKEGKSKKRGCIKLKLKFSSEKNSKVAFRDHRHLLRLLLLYQLEHTDIEPYSWNGQLEPIGEMVIMQHQVQNGLSAIEDLLVKWLEYCNMHMDHPMTNKIFPILLWKLLPALQNNKFDQEKEILFWEASKNLMPSCIKGIKRIHTLTPSDENICQISDLLRIISYFRSLKPPEGFELFPTLLYEWLLPCEDNCVCDAITVTKLAIIQGTEEWYDDLSRHYTTNDQNSSREARLNHAINIINCAMKNLCRATDIYDKIFQENLQISYSSTIYSAHQIKISQLVEPIIEEVYDLLKPLKLHNISDDTHENETLSLNRQLLNLYSTLQKFVVKGTDLQSEVENTKLQQYHLWFDKSVSQLLNIALEEALKRIKKAVTLDKLVPVTDARQISSSAVDTLDILFQIILFWQQLSWPDVEGSYVFVSKIIEDICCCSVFYADIMHQRVENLNDNSVNFENLSGISKEWCIAINNMEHIWHSIHPLINNLKMNDIVNEMGNIRGSNAVESCRQSFKLVIKNTMETVEHKISEHLQRKVKKLIPTITNFITGKGEELEKGEFNVEKLLQYLDKNLMILHSNLNKESFQLMLLLIWENIATIFSKVVENSLQEKRSRLYFCNLKKTVQILSDYFKGGDGVICDVESIKVLEEILSLYSMETSQLIHKFYLERLQGQRSMKSAAQGVITISAHFSDDVLKIQILNCRNLPPMDSNGSADPYVEIILLPREKFIGLQKRKTKTHKKTLFPLFDESFTFQLTPEQRLAEDGIVLFIVKDYDIIGNDFVGEAFFQFSEIELVNTMEDRELKQIHLNLSLPKNLDSQVSQALQLRQGDKIAKEFIKKERAKSEGH